MSRQDWGEFVQQWRNSYKQFTASFTENPDQPWKTVDEHHLDALRKLLVEHQLDSLWSSEQVHALSLIWHSLDPWPDSPLGIAALNKLALTASLSNGNTSLLEDLKAHGRLDFKHVFSADMFGAYKPSPKMYLGAVEKLGLQPDECAMVAAHLGDLKAAKSHGLRAVYVERPLEEDWSPEQVDQARSEGWVDVWISADQAGFLTLAKLLDSM
jgi:2-haloacid dehalogenase